LEEDGLNLKRISELQLKHLRRDLAHAMGLLDAISKILLGLDEPEPKWPVKYGDDPSWPEPAISFEPVDVLEQARALFGEPELPPAPTPADGESTLDFFDEPKAAP
jgi:hypothetical protein